MTKGKFYFLSDEYCEKFSKHGVMANKESTADGLHRRPCFYSIQDIKNDIQAMFYRAEMKHGVIIVPPLNSEEILR